MTLYTYVVRRDYGFAPNPFFGVCTLATCKPEIRKKAKLGDWVLGTGSAERKYEGKAIYLMCVTSDTHFDAYWKDPRYLCKRPVLSGSLKQLFGDNIYHRGNGGEWIQADSHHSKEEDGAPNPKNILRDTNTTERVLISSEFIYWGGTAPQIPHTLKQFVIARPGCKFDFAEGEVAAFVSWAKGLGQNGLIGDPLEWRYERYWGRKSGAAKMKKK